jgi:adenosyl cobinamide kinase/adenosyl cobinamide phosphate guanylyltransferase
MAMTLLTGGARSGKSALAARIASSWSGAVTFIATGEALDDEMRERIARHREARPADWKTVEEPVELRSSIALVVPTDLVIVDCLTLWVSNLFQRDCTPREIEERAVDAARAAAERPGPTLVVTNEVGSGIVPADPGTRSYRDALGTVNAIFARAAGRTFLVVAGRAVVLNDEKEVLRGVLD